MAAAVAVEAAEQAEGRAGVVYARKEKITLSMMYLSMFFVCIHTKVLTPDAGGRGNCRSEAIIPPKEADIVHG